MSRGGRREGSGRKPMVPEEKRVTVAARVLPETAEKIREMRKKGFRLGVAIDEMMKGSH